MPATMQKLKAPTPKPWPIPYFAHRGGTTNPEEENTLTAFEKALDIGSPGIELDVHFHKGKLKVTHYKRIAIRKRTPVLEEVLDFITKKCEELKRKKPIINIDLKSKGCGEQVASIIEKYVTNKKWKYTDFIVTAFTRKNIKGVRDRFLELKKLRNENKIIAIGIIGSRNTLKHYLRFIKEVNACSLNTKWKKNKFTAEFVNNAHNYGITIYPWNINTIEQMKDVFSKGVDGVITDYISVAKKVCSLKRNKDDMRSCDFRLDNLGH